MRRANIGLYTDRMVLSVPGERAGRKLLPVEKAGARGFFE